MADRKIPDRSWAKELSDVEFLIQYARRFPKADAIPTREDYLASKADEYEDIKFPLDDEINPALDKGDGKHISESDAGHKEIAALVAGKFSCEVCAEWFDSPHAVLVHKGRSHKVA